MSSLLISWHQEDFRKTPMEMAQVPIVPNASVSVVCIDGDRVTFELRDYTDHLAHVTVTDIE